MNRNQQPIQFTPRQIQERKYTTARMNLLFVVIITALNVFLALIQSGTYLLFAATGPMILADFGVFLFTESGNLTFLAIFGIVAAVATIPYLLCWLFSKKHVGWMIGALIYFSLDCIFLLMFLDVSIILDLLFHGWVMYYLILGVVSGIKLKNMPEDAPEVMAEGDFTVDYNYNDDAFNYSDYNDQNQDTADNQTDTPPEEDNNGDT